MKFYAVKNTNKIYTSWAECEAAVKGLSGSQLKSFKSLEQAQAYLSETEAATLDQPQVVTYDNGWTKGTITALEVGDPLAYTTDEFTYAVDGSFNSETGVYGAGVVLKTGEILFSTQGADKELAKARNVAGEVIAVDRALEHAIENGATEVTIICDYEGLFRWVAPKETIVNGQTCGWKAKNKVADTLVAATKAAAIAGLETINYIWVRGHQDVELNELADRAAKAACGVL